MELRELFKRSRQEVNWGGILKNEKVQSNLNDDLPVSFSHLSDGMHRGKR